MPHKKEYPRIETTVDAVVFGYKPGEGISVLLVMRNSPPFKNSWALPGGFVQPLENLEKAVLRALERKTSVRLSYIEQLYTFGEPARDPRGRVISVAYYALVKSADYEIHANDDEKNVRWFNVADLPALAFDHAQIIRKAVLRLQGKISYEPVGFDLLDTSFPLSDLHSLYETIYGREIDRRNFRKKILALGILKELKEKSTTGGRPATLYSFDKSKYFALLKKGIHFQL